MTIAKRIRQTQRMAKYKSIAKAKAIAPKLSVHIGSTPATRFRGDPYIFGRLVEDHDRHRALISMIQETHGDSKDRQSLFEELTREITAHAAAEEQALWSSVLRNNRRRAPRHRRTQADR